MFRVAEFTLSRVSAAETENYKYDHNCIVVVVVVAVVVARDIPCGKYRPTLNGHSLHLLFIVNTALSSHLHPANH